MSDASPTPLQPRRNGLRKWLGRGAILLLVIVAGLFFARRQIGSALAGELDKRLAARGVYLTWDSADWIQRNGIEVKGLALFRDAAKRDRLALLSNLTVIKGTPGWKSWDTFYLSCADATLTLGNGANETLFERMGMKLDILPGKVDLAGWQGNVRGLRIEMKGDYPHSPSPSGKSIPEKSAASSAGMFSGVNLDWLKTTKEWVKFESEGKGPVLRLEFHHQAANGSTEIAATLDGSAFHWRGQKWDQVEASARTTLGEKPSPVVIERLHVKRDGRSGELSATYEPTENIIQVSKLDSAIDALDLTRSLAPGTVDSLKDFSTRGNWHLTGDGRIPLAAPGDSRWNLRASLDGELLVSPGGARLEFQKPSFGFRFEKNVLTFSNARAGLWEGDFNMPEMSIHLPKEREKSRFDAQLTVEGARLRAVMASFKSAEEQPGVVRFNWKGGGQFSKDAITGQGTLGIREAEFYRVPLLGPLNIVFDQLTPGFAKDVATSLTSTHRIDGRTVHIENLKLESALTLVEARGTIDLAKQYARLTAQARLRGIAGLATFLVSALLEMEGEGPVDNVRWKLSHLPEGGLLKDAAGAAGKAGGAVIEGAGGVLRGTGEAAKDILKLPGKLLPRR